MESTIEKFNKLHQSTQKLEAALQEMWSLIDEIGEDDNFKNLLNQAKQYQSKKQKSNESLETLCDRLEEFENSKGSFV